MPYHAPPLDLYLPTSSPRELKEGMDEFNKKWLALHQSQDDLHLFHYTTFEGMKGILHDRGIRCSHASTFNDPLEIDYGRDVVSEFLRGKMSTDDRREIQSFLSCLLGNIHWFEKVAFDPFISCFCEKGSLLSQWRSYADQGGGFSLGFVFSDNTHVCSAKEEISKGKKVTLRKVIYDPRQQRELVSSYLENIIKAVLPILVSESQSQAPDQHKTADFMARQVANILLDMILTFKDRVFEEEAEWRLLRVTREDYQPESIEFMEKGNVSVPFRLPYLYNMTKTKKSAFPLRYIIYGPTHDPIQIESTVSLLIKRLASEQHPIKIDPNSVFVEAPGFGLRS